MNPNNDAELAKSVYDNAAFHQLRLHLIFERLNEAERNSDIRRRYIELRNLRNEIRPAMKQEQVEMVEEQLSNAAKYLNRPWTRDHKAIPYLDDADALLRVIADSQDLYFKHEKNYAGATGGRR